MAKIELLILALAVILLMFILAPLARGETPTVYEEYQQCLEEGGTRGGCISAEGVVPHDPPEKPLVINGGAQLEFKESEEAPFAVLSGDKDYMEFNYPPADLEWTCLDDLVSKVRCFKNKFYFKQKEEK